jgi:hypothetical protein
MSSKRRRRRQESWTKSPAGATPSILKKNRIGLIGWGASIVMRTDAQQGVILNMVVGIVGALIGFFTYGEQGPQVAGWFDRWEPRFAEGLHLLEALVRSPWALATLLEAAGPGAKEQVGKIRARRQRG